jgi:hypothetical protein
MYLTTARSFTTNNSPISALRSGMAARKFFDASSTPLIPCGRPEGRVRSTKLCASAASAWRVSPVFQKAAYLRATRITGCAACSCPAVSMTLRGVGKSTKRQPRGSLRCRSFVFTNLSAPPIVGVWISRTEGKSEVKRAALSELRLDPYSSRMFFDHHFCNVESKSYAATILAVYL